MLDINKETGSSDMIRRAKDAKEYADTVKDVGKEYGIPVLDVWSAFMKAAGWKGDGLLPGSEESGKNEVLAKLLYDGKITFSPWPPHLSPRTELADYCRSASQPQWVQDCV